MTYIDDFNELSREIEFRKNHHAIYTEEAYCEYLNEILLENGDLKTELVYSPYLRAADSRTRSGTIKADGFSFDFESNGIHEFFVILLDYSQSDDVPQLNTSELENRLKQAKRFIENCQDDKFLRSLDESSSGYPMVLSLTNNYDIIILIS